MPSPRRPPHRNRQAGWPDRSVAGLRAGTRCRQGIPRRLPMPKHSGGCRRWNVLTVAGAAPDWPAARASPASRFNLQPAADHREAAGSVRHWQVGCAGPPMSAVGLVPRLGGATVGCLSVARGFRKVTLWPLHSLAGRAHLGSMIVNDRNGRHCQPVRRQLDKSGCAGRGGPSAVCGQAGWEGSG